MPLIGRQQALEWPLSLNLMSKNYHGEVFEGNSCRKLLKNADCLLQMPNISKSVLLPYVSTIKAMDNVVHQAFSTTIKPGLNASILNL